MAQSTVHCAGAGRRRSCVMLGSECGSGRMSLNQFEPGVIGQGTSGPGISPIQVNPGRHPDRECRCRWASRRATLNEKKPCKMSCLPCEYKGRRSSPGCSLFRNGSRGHGRNYGQTTLRSRLTLAIFLGVSNHHSLAFLGLRLVSVEGLGGQVRKEALHHDHSICLACYL